MSPKQQTVWSRLFVANQDWSNKDEFLDIIYWGRQIVAMIIGIICGYLGWQGVYGITTFGVLNSFIVYVYSTKVNNDHEEMFEFIKEGFMNAFAVFMVTWIMTYSFVYY